MGNHFWNDVLVRVEPALTHVKKHPCRLTSAQDVALLKLRYHAFEAGSFGTVWFGEGDRGSRMSYINYSKVSDILREVEGVCVCVCSLNCT